MKSKIKMFFGLGILACFTFLIFSRCQTEENIHIDGELNHKFPYKITTLSKIDIESNVKLNNQIQEFSKIKPNNIDKNIYNDVHNFIIHTDEINFIENTQNDSHSYTLAVERENYIGSELENLVFTYNPALDNYDASLVTYHFSDTQKQEFLVNGHISSSNYSISHEPIAINIDDVIIKSSISVPCTTNFTVYHIIPDSDDNESFLYSSTIGNVHNQCQHEDANGNSLCTTYTQITYDCPDGGSAGSPTGNVNDPTNGGSAPPNNEGLITTPTINKTEQVLDINVLSLDMNNWLNENLEIKNELIELLNNNPEEDNFIIETIEALMEDEELTLEDYLAMQIVFDAPDNPIDDIDNYLSCFDTNQPAVFTIYVDQPNPGTRDTWTISGGVGHGYIGIRQGDQERILGLYPQGSATPFNPDDPRVYGDDSERHYDVSISKEISAFQLWAIITEITQTDSNYNLSTNNCSTFALEIGQLASINLPSTFGNWPGGYGNNPGDLGEDIRETDVPGATKDTDGGTSPSNSED